MQVIHLKACKVARSDLPPPTPITNLSPNYPCFWGAHQGSFPNRWRSNDAETSPIDRQGTTLLSSKESVNGMLTSRQDLHRDGLLADKSDASRVPVDVHQTPQWLICGQAGEMSPNMVVVCKEPKLPSRNEAEGKS